MLLDQMFTADNFRRIFDAENRKGLDLVDRFYEELQPQTEAIRDQVAAIRELRLRASTMKAQAFENALTALKMQLADLKAKKSAAIDKAMEDVSLTVLKPDFKISLSKKNGPKGKPVYCVDESPATFFVIKQLQRNLFRLYGVKQSNRHDLVCQVRDTIGAKYNYEVVRTDISSFYESVDRRRLLAKLDEDQLLSPSSKKFIKQVLDAYGLLSGMATGLPRGVGISAYLAELYLRATDRAIRAIPGLILYCRYVDDIVAVFARPPTGQSIGNYRDRLLEILGAHGLSHNAEKTQELTTRSIAPAQFEFLGYRFCLTNGGLMIEPSAAKIEKYRNRLALSFHDYAVRRSINSRKAFRTLVARIKFLTGNTRLVNSKSNAVTGIYYNNSIANDLTHFEELDKLLRAHVDEIRRPLLRRRLKSFKFVEGFKERRFHNFSSQELQVIVRAWKHG